MNNSHTAHSVLPEADLRQLEGEGDHVARPTRWQHLAVEDEHVLLELAALPGDVGDVALDALTHLPLRVEAWERVRSLLRGALAVAGKGERRRFLSLVLRWLPLFEPGDAIADDL